MNATLAYFIGLILALVAFWLGLSGHYTPLILSLGAGSIAVTAILSYRLDILDREGAPHFRVFSFILYLPWLIIEIIKANITVIRACLRADLDINPALVKVKTICQSDLAKVTFANSITLTPGTVTIDIEGDKLLVHGLYEEDAAPENFAEMDRRSAKVGDRQLGANV